MMAVMRSTAALLLLLLLPPSGLLAQAVDFEREIAPILVARCVACHGPEKQKGDLRLDRREHVFAVGEEDYWSVLPKDPANSELLRRLRLPADDEEVMPKNGEPLTSAQQRLFERWIRGGAEWPAAGDEWIARKLAAATLPKIEFVLPQLDERGQQQIEAAIAALRERGVVVQRVAADTDAIDVNMSLLRERVTDRELKLLLPLAPRLVWLNVSRTALTDDGLATLGALAQLRRLNVANTNVTDRGFRLLTGLRRLEYLNAYGTELTDDALPQLMILPRLQQLYAWQTKVTAPGVQAARDHIAKLRIDLGDYVEERLRAAEQEVAARDRPVNTSCPVTGEPIDADQVVEHDGRRVAFCCAKCKAAFEQNPQDYVDQLPADKSGQSESSPADQPKPKPKPKAKPAGQQPAAGV